MSRELEAGSSNGGRIMQKLKGEYFGCIEILALVSKSFAGAFLPRQEGYRIIGALNAQM